MSKQVLFTVTKDDLEIQTFRAGGKGGQNQNKRDTGVRIIHRASGAVGEARDERSQEQNKRLAFRRMAESQKFKAWVKLNAAAKMQGFRDLEAKVDKMLEHVQIETYEPEEK